MSELTIIVGVPVAHATRGVGSPTLHLRGLAMTLHAEPASHPRPLTVVVVPAYQSSATVAQVARAFLAVADAVVVSDDGSTDGTCGILETLRDPRLHVIRCERNGGVGAATKRGIAHALGLGAEIVVKADADDQMDARELSRLIAPLARGEADVAKGNRFAHAAALAVSMPRMRRWGSLGVAWLMRMAAGRRLADPANGYVAWRATLLRSLDLKQSEDRYRFEVSMLLLAVAAGATIVDVAIPARPSRAGSFLNVWWAIPSFGAYLLRAIALRIWRKRVRRLTRSTTTPTEVGLHA